MLNCRENESERKECAFKAAAAASFGIKKKNLHTYNNI